MTLGENIRESRELREMSRQELSLKANIASTSLYYYEKNIKTPSSEALMRIANVLEVSTDYLLGIETKTTSPDTDLIPVPIYDLKKEIFNPYNKNISKATDYLFITEKSKRVDFGIVINDDSMHPKIKISEIALFKEQKRLKNEDIGIFLSYEKHLIIKKYIKISNNEYQLISFNTNYPTVIVNNNNIENYKIIGKYEGKLIWDE